MGNHEESKIGRRDALKSMALAVAGAGLAGTAAAQNETPAAEHETVIGMRFSPLQTVRVGVVGVGGRGTGMLPNFLGVDSVRVTAVCDVVPERVRNAQAIVTKAGQPAPAGYSNGEHDFENLCRRDDVDFVYVATPWEWHTPMALAALKNGKHAGIEVPGATNLEDCWSWVNASEKYRRHCLLMENCCYGETEMLLRNLISAGMLGDILHGEGAYLHDLRGELFDDKGEALWRRAWHTRENGNLYPTHGLGPIANYMNINRGDRFDYLVSMSSPEAGFSRYRQEHVPQGDPRWRERYICGDMNTSLIKTARGRTIMVQHDVCNPRPYSRINAIEGTKGLFRDYPPRIYFDGQDPEEWTSIDQLKATYQHPLWARAGELARKMGGHGGMDFIMIYRLAQCMTQGLAPDNDVYDAAAWAAVAPLSQASVAQNSMPVKVPDFTRGRWQQTRTAEAG